MVFHAGRRSSSSSTISSGSFSSRSSRSSRSPFRTISRSASSPTSSSRRPFCRHAGDRPLALIIAGYMDLSIESVMALGDGDRHPVRRLGRRARHHADAGRLVVPVSPPALAVGAVVGATNAFFVVRLKMNAFTSRSPPISGAAPSSCCRRPLGAGNAGRAPVRDRALPQRAADRLGADRRDARLRSQPAEDPFGRHLLLIGATGRRHRAGIRRTGWTVITFILAGVIAGLAGWLLAIRTSGATANLGVGMLRSRPRGGRHRRRQPEGRRRQPGRVSMPACCCSPRSSTAINLMGMPISPS